MFKKVVVLFGGRSSEHDISKISAATVLSALSDKKYSVMPVYITKQGKWLLYEGSIENINNVQWEKFGTPVVLSPDTNHKGLLRFVGDKFKNIPVDVVFPVLHGLNGEDGSIAGLCELAGLPYVGCGILSSSICMDKAYTKVIVDALGIAQAKHMVIHSCELDEKTDEIAKKIRYEIGYPCFVKPANAGSSVGISKAANKKELVAALLTAAKHDRKIIVEKAVAGREFECAVLGNEDAQASGVGEIKAAAEFYDFDSKYNSSDSVTIVPAELDGNITEDIRKKSVAIFKAVDGCGMARVDFFVEDSTNRIIFNEINTIPGFTPISMYPMLWNDKGLTNAELVDKLIELALERHS